MQGPKKLVPSEVPLRICVGQEENGSLDSWAVPFPTHPAASTSIHSQSFLGILRLQKNLHIAWIFLFTPN